MIAPPAFVFSINPLTVASSLAVAAGIYFFCHGLSLLARKRGRKATASTTGNALPGLVEVHGFASGPKTISAPLTGQPCYLYRTVVWQQRHAATNEFEKVAEETLHVPFFLNDSTGPLLIEPSDADLDLQSEFHKEYDPLLVGPNEMPQPVSLFLARHQVTPVRRIRIEECCIRTDRVLFIMGTVRENPGVEIGLATDTPQPRPADTPEVIRLSVGAQTGTSEGMTQQSKIAAALVKAGVQQPNAWEAAGESSASAALAEKLQADDLPRQLQSASSPALVLMKGSGNAPLLISWRGPRASGRTHGWRSAALLCAGVILSLGGLYVLLVTVRLP